jgi:hypothetical protein
MDGGAVHKMRRPVFTGAFSLRPASDSVAHGPESLRSGSGEAFCAIEKGASLEDAFKAAPAPRMPRAESLP